MHINSTIKSIDQSKHMVKLDNGTDYTFDTKFDLSRFKVGDKVKLDYNDQNGKHMANRLEVAR